MPTFKAILTLAILILIGVTAWQVGAAEVANLNFQEDIRDLAAQAGTHVGVVIPRSDEQVMQVVIQKAGEHGIELTPEQVTVRRASTGEHSTWYLAVDYTVPINLGVTSFHMHFAPTSERRGT